MITALLLGIALASPLQVTPLEASIEVGQVKFEFKPGKPPGRTWVYITDGDDLLLCSLETKQTHATVAAFLTAAAAYTGPDADLGEAKRGIASTNAGGYCNVSATVKEGLLLLVWMSNDRCFGSAGCIREYASTAVSDRSELAPLIARFHEAAR